MDDMQFLDILDGLSAVELAALCRQFSLDYNAFPGDRRDKARAFLGYMQRHGRLTGLAEATVALRPDLATAVAQVFAGDEAGLAWLDQLPGGGGTMASGVTWRWPSAGAGLAAASDDVTPPEPPATAPTTANPYTPGRAVTDDAMLFGRAEELALLASRLAAGSHVAIVSARRMGASSLLRQAARAAGGDGRLAAYVDMKEPAHQTLPGLLDAVWRQWWAAVKPDAAVPVRTLAEFVTAARKLNAAGFRPLIFLDELEQLAWRPGLFGDALLDTWSELGRAGEVGFALAAHATPVDLLAQGGYVTRFYELFQQLDLGLLDAGAARALLTEPAGRAGLAVPEGAADHLLAQAGPHPFFLQLAGLYLFDDLSRGTYSRAGVTGRFRAAAEPYWQELWDLLSPLAQQHYPTTRINTTAGLAERQLRILARRGLVVADENGYRPLSDGFADWRRRGQAAEAAALSSVV